MNIGLRITLTVQENGRLVKRRSFKGHSYVRAMVDMLWPHLLEDTSVGTTLDTSNVARTLNANSGNFKMKASAADDTRGIVIGTGTTAVALADYALQTKIAHGVGAGQMQYQAVQGIAPFTTGTTRKLQLTREFINNSGASITVNETGLYVYGAGLTWIFCIARDIIAGGQVVNNGQTLTVQYDISVTV